MIYGQKRQLSGLGFVSVDENSSFIAVYFQVALTRLCEDETPVGAKVTATHKDEGDTLTFA